MDAPSPASTATFSLDIPPDPSALSTARLFAAAVARESGCEEALLDDVKLAVSEACTDAIRRAEVEGDSTISLRAAVGEEGVAFEVVGPAGEASSGEDDLDHLSLIAALFQDARRDRTGDRASISFSAPLG